MNDNDDDEKKSSIIIISRRMKINVVESRWRSTTGCCGLWPLAFRTQASTHTVQIHSFCIITGSIMGSSFTRVQQGTTASMATGKERYPRQTEEFQANCF